MRIAFASQFDADDISAWSGIVWHMYRSLAVDSVHVEKLPPLIPPRSPLFALKHVFHKMILRQAYGVDREPGVLRSLAHQLSAHLRVLQAGGRIDWLLGPSSLPFAQLETDTPFAFWCDATFAALRADYFPRISTGTVRNAERAEAAALARCRLAIFSSDWAARSAVQHYGISAEKVKVVPFGANNFSSPTVDDVERRLAALPYDQCRLLLLGVDWNRKGAAFATEVAAALNLLGLPTRLDIVGCQPPAHFQVPDCVQIHPFISKRTSEGRAKLARLLDDSHFFILPSRAEAYGIVFAEASSHGVPALATNVGGIPTVVRDGINGRSFDLDTPAAIWAEAILSFLEDRSAYEALCRSSFDEYKSRLNWQTAGEHVIRLLTEASISSEQPG